ncbi:M3 family metallopeptidase [Advenella sp. WQ 585]|uniref:oligopeptidase A n=1 Tax=Advenella mandrilli TaxID=2800330 RepID=A0ABS1EFS9_9BURK|nr:M3 family metallopeptidase [Advenella mandrilli]MBK1781197.1 M3 family metallopeptidase [Advenella mandrilli]
MNSNPLLAPLSELIDYSAIKPEHLAPALNSLLDETRLAINEIVEKVKEPTWDSFIEPLEYDSARLWRAWSVAGHLNSVVNTPELRDAYNAMLPKITEFSTWIGLNKELYQQYLKLSQCEAFNHFTPTRKRIIELALRNFRLSGVELEGENKERYAKISEKIALTSQKFSENSLDAVDSWELIVSDEKELEGLPQDAINAARQAAQAENKEGWKFTLKMPSYLPVMQYAKSQALRERLYRGYATIASEQGDAQFDNSSNIEKLLALRTEEAHLLGYGDFAQMRLETRMADNATQVVDFLRNLAAKAKPFAQNDVDALKQFASQSLGMDDLQPWDYAYVSEQLRQSRYAYSDEEVKQYLPEPKVIDGLFYVIGTLFNVELEPFKAPVWHESVAVYAVKENNNLIGYLYTDLYARAGKQSGAWVDSERTRHLHGDNLHTPVVYLTCNFPPPQDNKPALLTHDDVITLFHESGHALHALLSKVNEPAASPFASVEWDAIELPSQFMENFCWEWSVLQKLSGHWETQEPLPESLYQKMLAAKNYQSGMQTVRQIEFSLFDMLLHQRTSQTSIADVLALLNEVRQEVAVIIPPAWHRFPHNFSHLFAGGYGAGYYSYKWAEVLSSDAYSLFEENTLDNHGTLNPIIGNKFRQEILAVGGSRPAAESFKAFRGREPSPDALLRHCGMTEVA